MIKLTLHVGVLVLCLASIVTANTLDESESLFDRVINQTKLSQSEENDHLSLPGISKLADSTEHEPIVERPSNIMKHSKPVDDSKEPAKHVNKSIKQLAIEDEATTEDNQSKAPHSNNATVHTVGDSTLLEGRVTNPTVATKSPGNDGLTKQTLGNETHSNTLQGLQEKLPQNITQNHNSNTEFKNNTGLREAEKNATSKETYWSVWSSSNQPVPRTALLTGAALICILASKAMFGLGTE